MIIEKVTQEMVVTQLGLLHQADMKGKEGRTKLFKRINNLRIPARAKACIKAAKIYGDDDAMKAAKDRLRVLSKVSKGGAS